MKAKIKKANGETKIWIAKTKNGLSIKQKKEINKFIGYTMYKC